MLCGDEKTLTLVLALLLQLFFENVVWLPETLFVKVDEGLTEVLPRRLAVEEVAFIWIDLNNHREKVTWSSSISALRVLQLHVSMLTQPQQQYEEL